MECGGVWRETLFCILPCAQVPFYCNHNKLTVSIKLLNLINSVSVCKLRQHSCNCVKAFIGGGMRLISYDLPSVIQCHFLCLVVVKALLNPSSPFNLAKGKLITILHTIEFRPNWEISDNLCKFIQKLSFPLCSSSNTDDSSSYVPLLFIVLHHQQCHYMEYRRLLCYLIVCSTCL